MTDRLVTFFGSGMTGRHIAAGLAISLALLVVARHIQLEGTHS